MADVAFDLDFKQAFVNKDRGGKLCVVGVASDDLPDAQRERVTSGCLEKWAGQCREGLPLLDSHSGTFPFGVSYDGVVKKGGEGQSELEVHFELDPEYPQARTLFAELQKGSCDKQMSIGGDLNLENPDCVKFAVQDDGTILRELEDVDLEHITTTRSSRAANERSGFSAAIVKSLDASYQHMISPPTKSEVQAGAADVEKSADAPADAPADALSAVLHAFSRTGADPWDGHSHFARVDGNGNGMTDVEGSPPHAHTIRKGTVMAVKLLPEYTSKHPGDIDAATEGSGFMLSQVVDEGGGEGSFSIQKTDSELDVIKPLSGHSDLSIPEKIRRLPVEKQKQWVRTFNRSFASCIAKHGAGVEAPGRTLRAKSESFAFARANAAVVKEEKTMDPKKTVETAGGGAAVAVAEGSSVNETSRNAALGAGFLADLGKALLKDTTGGDDAPADTAADAPADAAADAPADAAADTAADKPAVDADAAADAGDDASTGDEGGGDAAAEAAVTAMNALAKAGVADGDKEGVRLAAVQLLKASGAEDVGESFLSAAERGGTLKAELLSELKEFATTLVKGLVATVEKVGGDTATINKSLDVLNKRIARVEAVEGGGAGGDPDDDNDIAKTRASQGKDQGWGGIFTAARTTALKQNQG